MKSFKSDQIVIAGMYNKTNFKKLAPVGSFNAVDAKVDAIPT